MPCLFYLITFWLIANSSGQNFRLTILHTNDLHAAFEGVHSKDKSYGGMGRAATFLKRERQKLTGPNEGIIYLDGGDMFTGTDWFAFNGTSIAADFMKLLRPDAICLGNHEFDLGYQSLKRYIDLIGQPIVTCNVNISEEPSLKGKIIPSKILEVKNRKIGVVGYLHPSSRTTDKFWGKIKLNPEGPLIKREISKFKKQKINIIILLTHGGYKRDIKIAERSADIDVIVDGHSHSFLYSGKDRIVINDNKIDGPYPTIIQNSKGKKVYIVQAYCNAQYVGKFIVTFNSKGHVIKTGGRPFFLGPKIKIHDDAKRFLKKYRSFVEKKRNEIVGKSRTYLRGGRPCRLQECNLGNLIMDAYVFHAAQKNNGSKYWSNTSIAIMNSGNIRQSITPHWRTNAITYAQIMAVLPFFNILVTMTITGKVLLRALEHSLSWKKESHKGEFLQVSGLRITYDYNKPLGSRVVKVRVRCARCEIPKYETLEVNARYNVITSDFVAGGGGGYSMFKYQPSDNGIDNDIDLQALKDYLFHHDTVDPEVEERIVILNDKRPISDPQMLLPTQ